MSRATARAVVGYLAVALLALLVLPMIGAERLPFKALLAHLSGDTNPYGTIFFQQRLPRVLLGIAVGGSLAVAGAALQILFRNPLAEPWTLGIAGGAALGAFVAHAFPAFHASFGPLNTAQGLSLAGAAGVMTLIYLLSRRSGAITTHVLLLAGVTLGVISGGLIMLLTYFIAPYQFVAFHRWMMGGLDVIGYGEIGAFCVLGLPGLLLLFLQARAYNQLTLGEDMAMGHGVDVPRVHALTFLGAGLTTAACVAVAGPIAFIGMVIPHACRALSGFDNRVVLPASFLLGGAVLALCDTAARTLVAPTEIPVGAITAVLGGPAFLFLLVRRP